MDRLICGDVGYGKDRNRNAGGIQGSILRDDRLFFLPPQLYLPSSTMTT